MGQAEKAVNLLHKVLKITPDNADAWQELGLIHSHQRKYKLALKCLEKASEQGNASRHAFYHHGQSALQVESEYREYSLL